jgi:cysteine desulfuration protein SufE
MTKKITIDELLETFSLMTDWEEKYSFLISLGEKLPPLDNQYKNDDFKVNGCVSQVWMVIGKNDAAIFDIKADSDAILVKGLIAIVLSAFDGKKAEEIIAFDIDALFKTLGLDQQLSPNRRNGFFAMVEKIKKTASLSR